MPARRPPRDSQRGRLYRAEHRIPGSPLPDLRDCERFMVRVVDSAWWHQRFPTRGLASVPELRAGLRVATAFYRRDDTETSITIPPDYRTAGVVLHELVHWGLDTENDLTDHGLTFARTLLDATRRFISVERAERLVRSYDRHDVRVARAARRGPDGRWRYWCDERLALARGKPITVRHRSDRTEWARLVGNLEGVEQHGSVLRFSPASRGGRARRLPVAAVWDVRAIR